jgi:phosphatase NudJ
MPGREPIPTFYFALVVVRLGHRFLLVHETKHEQRWYLPAGRAEKGETLEQAAIRETREEAGIDVSLDGLLRLEHTPSAEGFTRVRAFFLAHPTDDAALKTVADEHSQRAEWVSLDDLERYPLRGEEVKELLEHVDTGVAVYPLSLLAREDEPWRG